MNKASLNWTRVVIASLAGTVVVLALLYAGYNYLQLQQQDAGLEKNNMILEKGVGALEQSLIATRATLDETTQALQTAQNVNNGFSSQINQLSGTVSTLQKITATDPQLLEKYSKVYFLSENYTPASLSTIDPHYLADTSRPELILSGVVPFLDALIASAGRAGVTLNIVSAYRSYYEQASLKLGYKVTYGAGTANQFSAEQGYSEHQLGTAVDFSTPTVQNTFVGFASSTAYQWLTNNAYQFGFILSYPPNNIYYQFEPWHWRFVGVQLATTLHTNNEYFYNMSQRDIDQYLGSFFD